MGVGGGRGGVELLLSVLYFYTKQGLACLGTMVITQINLCESKFSLALFSGSSILDLPHTISYQVSLVSQRLVSSIAVHPRGFLGGGGWCD